MSLPCTSTRSVCESPTTSVTKSKRGLAPPTPRFFLYNAYTRSSSSSEVGGRGTGGGGGPEGAATGRPADAPPRGLPCLGFHAVSSEGSMRPSFHSKLRLLTVSQGNSADSTPSPGKGSS